MKKEITLSLLLIGVVFLSGCGNSTGGGVSPEPPGPGEPNPPTGCLHTSEVKFTTSEEARMKEIMLSVMQGDNSMPTLAIYNEFWLIMNKYGKLCQEDISLTRDSLGAADECNNLFYQDALISLQTGKIYKSVQRADCEYKTITKARIKENEELISKILIGQPITTATGSVVFTEEIIQSTINNIKVKLDGLYKLFSESPPTDSTKAELDKGCENIHGPSVYVEIPKSNGGGAYCDCKPGYILKPMMVDGVSSSWCVKK